LNDTSESPQPHSWEYFGEARDFWWNLDFLELMAVRLQFDQVGTVLDAGCGIGHWGQLLARVLPPQTRFIGVDREERSLARARERAIQFWSTVSTTSRETRRHCRSRTAGSTWSPVRRS
jgi:SAM-dependent methyltransferase